MESYSNRHAALCLVLREETELQKSGQTTVKNEKFSERKRTPTQIEIHAAQKRRICLEQNIVHRNHLFSCQNTYII